MFTFREWMRRIETRASGPGGGNSIFRSMRPGRRSAGSKISDSMYPLVRHKNERRKAYQYDLSP